MLRILKWVLISLPVLVLLLFGAAYLATYHPADVEPVAVSGSGGQKLSRSQPLKVLSWNVQYMAGKNYVFFYDLPGDAGPDTRPSPGDIAATLDGVARLIRDENPDVLLLQEVNIGAANTDHQDQLALLLDRLPEDYRYRATAFYHKAAFVPHPKIMGSVGMTLAVISKYPIASARRHQLPVQPNDPLTKMFYFKRCILECHLPLAEGGELVLLDTHLDAFAQGTDTMQRQVALVKGLLEELDAEGTPWMIGGDFNLLPPGQRPYVSESRRDAYQETSELAALAQWPSIPSFEDSTGPDRERWFTHFPNDPEIAGPDRTIDFIFHSRSLQSSDTRVIHGDALSLSDHLPIVATFRLTE